MSPVIGHGVSCQLLKIQFSGKARRLDLRLIQPVYEERGRARRIGGQRRIGAEALAQICAIARDMDDPLAVEQATLISQLSALPLSRSPALPLSRSGDVVCRPINDNVVSRQLFVALSAERSKTTAQKTVISVVQDLILEGLAAGDLPGARAA